jgi:D-arabinose 1-dehydrogenase-like Zn-dependent alcohol dehydrogenase
LISYQVEAFGQPLAHVLRDTPTPQGSEVLLRVSHCGVCHSDVHVHDGYFSLGEGQKLNLSRSIVLPHTLGHEIAGTVVALGPQATGVAIGNARVAYPWIGCGHCNVCASGHEELCAAPRVLGLQRAGGFADHVLVPDARYLVDPGAVPLAQACTYACAGITAYAALKKAAPLAAGDTLLVIGAGGVGLSGVRLAKRLFPQANVVVAEIDASKAEFARAAGASEVIDPSAADAGKALVKVTRGGVAAAIDFVGAGSSFAFAFGALRKGGRLVCVGLFGGATPIVPVMVAMKAVSVLGSYVGTLQDLRELIALANDSHDGTLPALAVTERPLAQAAAALDDLRHGRVRGRVVLTP